MHTHAAWAEVRTGAAEITFAVLPTCRHGTAVHTEYIPNYSPKPPKPKEGVLEAAGAVAVAALNRLGAAQQSAMATTMCRNCCCKHCFGASSGRQEQAECLRTVYVGFVCTTAALQDPCHSLLAAAGWVKEKPPAAGAEAGVLAAADPNPKAGALVAPENPDVVHDALF
jgi:hypothetical protein